MAGRGACGASATACCSSRAAAFEVAGRHLLGGLLAQIVGPARAVAGLLGLVELLRDRRRPAPIRASARRWPAGPAAPRSRSACLRASAARLRRGRAGRPSGSPAPARAGRGRGRRGSGRRGRSRCSCTRTARSYSPRRRNRLPSAKCSSEVSGSFCTASMKASIALSCCSLSRKFRPLEVGLRRLAVLDPQLPQVEARGEPAEHEGERQAQQQPAEVKVHRVADGSGRSVAAAGGAGAAATGATGAAGSCAAACGGAATSSAPCRARRRTSRRRRRPAPPAPAARASRAEEEVDGRVVLVVQREGEQGEKNGCLEQPQEVFHARPRWPGAFYASRLRVSRLLRRRARAVRCVDRFAQRLARLEVRHAAFRGSARCSPERGLRPMRGGRRLIEKLPKPRISMRCPRTSASLIASRIVLTAYSASRCVSCAKRAASSSTRSDRVITGTMTR